MELHHHVRTRRGPLAATAFVAALAVAAGAAAARPATAASIVPLGNAALDARLGTDAGPAQLLYGLTSTAKGDPALVGYRSDGSIAVRAPGLVRYAQFLSLAADQASHVYASVYSEVTPPQYEIIQYTLQRNGSHLMLAPTMTIPLSTSCADVPGALTVDKSGTLYSVVSVPSCSSDQDYALLGWNSSGALTRNVSLGLGAAAGQRTIATDAAGNVYTSEGNSYLMEINPVSGTITRSPYLFPAQTQFTSTAFAPNGDLYISNFGGSSHTACSNVQGSAIVAYHFGQSMPFQTLSDGAAAPVSIAISGQRLAVANQCGSNGLGDIVRYKRGTMLPPVTIRSGSETTAIAYGNAL